MSNPHYETLESTIKDLEAHAQSFTSHLEFIAKLQKLGESIQSQATHLQALEAKSESNSDSLSELANELSKVLSAHEEKINSFSEKLVYIMDSITRQQSTFNSLLQEVQGSKQLITQKFDLVSSQVDELKDLYITEAEERKKGLLSKMFR